MKKKLKTILVIGIAAAAACSCDKTSTPTVYRPADTNPAMNNPDKFAWQMFVEISRPAEDGNPDGPVVWETWALAKKVFADPNNPPTWKESARSDEALDGVDAMPLQQQKILQMLGEDPVLKFDPGKPGKQIVSLAETRLNKDLFNFILAKDLYYQEGIEAYMEDKKILDLPIQSKEIKAIWDTINPAHKNLYHYVIQKDKSGHETYWGLTALHIISKDLPQWTWTTFEHVNNPRLPEVEKVEYLKSVDRFGRKDGKITPELQALFAKNKLPQKWENYILRGSQLFFTTFTGKPTLLGNTRTEEGFIYTSSCITCHAKATIGSSLEYVDLPKKIKDSLRSPYAESREEASHYFNSLAFFSKLPAPDPVSGETIVTPYGTPSPRWFDTTYVSGKKDTFKQLDFVWAFTRAKRRNPYKPL